MGSQKRDMNYDEALLFVESKAKKKAKEAILGAAVWGITKLPGSGKIESGFKKITDKVPKGLSVNIDPQGQKFSIGFKTNF